MDAACGCRPECALWIANRAARPVILRGPFAGSVPMGRARSSYPIASRDPGRAARLLQQSSGFFSFLYLKKIKISKIYGGFEKFQNYTPVASCLGDKGACPPLAGRQDLNVKKITFRSWRPGRIKQRTCKINIKS